jgi:hypothetical protein
MGYRQRLLPHYQRLAVACAVLSAPLQRLLRLLLLLLGGVCMLLADGMTLMQFFRLLLLAGMSLIVGGGGRGCELLCQLASVGRPLCDEQLCVCHFILRREAAHQV